MFLFAIALLPATLRARVVINEIFYHAPDDIDGLAYIELHNTEEDPVDLSGWSFTRGVKVTAASVIAGWSQAIGRSRALDSGVRTAMKRQFCR